MAREADFRAPRESFRQYSMDALSGDRHRRRPAGSTDNERVRNKAPLHHRRPEINPIARCVLFAVRTVMVVSFSLVLLSVLLVFLLKWVTPPTSSFMLQKRLQTVSHASGAKKEIRYQWVDYRDISPALAIAVVAAEDQIFLFHHGFDLRSIKKAMEHNAGSAHIRGASTISQQVVKNLFLWPDRSLIRKGLEAYLTVLAECFWGKRRILEMYLNLVELGDGIYGVEVASRLYFKKSAGQLKNEEAALLAAVLPDPCRYSVKHPSAHVQRRKVWILKQMRLLGASRYVKDLR